MSEKLTMADIAKMAGVGKSTVSRYFNGGYVKEETKEKIKKIVEENHYEPNAVAQMLKAKKSNTIGIIAPTLDSVTSSRMMMTMNEYLISKGYDAIVMSTNYSEERELKLIDKLWKMNCDGIVLLATNISDNHRELSKLVDIPVVFVGQKINNTAYVIYDDYHAGFEVGNYIASKGHRDILYVGVTERDEAVGINRKMGVYDALESYEGMKIDFLETTFSFDYTARLIKEYIKNTESLPTAFVCATDNMALAAYKELNYRGIRVPDDVSIISFGDYEYSHVVTPSITAIRFENEEAGCIAGQTIIDMIDGKEYKKRQVVGYVLIEGGSVKEI